MVDVLPRSRSPEKGGLVELVEPLFLYVCRLNRIARSQGHPSYEQTRNEVGELISSIKDESAREVALARQFEQVEMPLVFFVDSLISESALGFRDRWHQTRLAAERGELAGDEKFFDMLDACLSDASEEATERLAIYYTCLGLGFMGMYAGDPLQIDTRMQRVVHRIRRRWMVRDFDKKLTAEAYEHTDKSDLPKPSRDSVTKIVTICVCGLVTLVLVYTFLYRDSTGELYRLSEEIVQSATVTPKPTP